MDVADLMDALQVHAAAAAVTASSAKFYDVAVGFPVGKGKCVRIFYAGETEPPHFPNDRTLNSQLMAEKIIVRGYWPNADTGTNRQRLTEIEMATFVKSFRTRVLGDSQLGGESVDLTLSAAVVEQVVIADTKYAVVDMEVAADFNEYTLAP